MIERIGIIGDGAMGTVSAILLANKGRQVTVWGAFESNIRRLIEDGENKRFLPGYRIPPDVRFTTDHAEIVSGRDLLVAAVPCQHMREVWERLAPHYTAGTPFCSVAKGIENHTLLRPTQIIEDVLGSVPVAALSGPSIADELARHLPATVAVASRDEKLADRIQEAFSTQCFRVYTNPDLLGVELAGATKNVIALAAGILDGLQAGDNAKAALLTRGLVEISRLGVAMGAEPGTFSGLAGLGDLVTTCVSPHGRNRSCGEQIGRGKKVRDVLAETHSVVEGVPTTQSVVELADRHGIDMPITRAVHAVLFDDKDAIDATTELMARTPRGEL